MIDPKNLKSPQEYAANLVDREQCWFTQDHLGNDIPVLYHKDIEFMGRLYGVDVSLSFCSGDHKIGSYVCKATALNPGGKVYESFGEASPMNNGFMYPMSVAEKRAVDRVILKSLGLHGDYYSDAEIERKGKVQTKVKDNVIQIKQVQEEKTIELVQTEILDAEDEASFNAKLSENRILIERWVNEGSEENKARVHNLLNQIQLRQIEFNTKQPQQGE